MVVFSSCNSKIGSQRLVPTGRLEASSVTVVAPSAETEGVSKFSNPGCQDPDLNLVAETISLSMCDGTIGKGKLPLCKASVVQSCLISGDSVAVDMNQIIPDNIRQGDSIANVVGTALAIPKNCSGDGAIGCVANVAFPAVGVATLTPGLVRKSVTIAGVTGEYPSANYPLAGSDITSDLVTMTLVSQLASSLPFEWFDDRGNRNLASGDTDLIEGNVKSGVTIFGALGTAPVVASPSAWTVRNTSVVNGVTGKLKTACRNNVNPATMDAGQFVYVTADQLTDTFDAVSHGFAENDAIRFSTQVPPSGVTPDATTYYIRNATQDDFQISLTLGGSPVNFTSNGSIIFAFHWGDGIPNTWDSIDDFNAAGSPFAVLPTSNIWGQEYFCGGMGTSTDSAIWEDLTADGLCDNMLDECIYKDKISGLEWTELQYTSASWPVAVWGCETLIFNGTAWRVPTEKEFIDALAHGIYSVTSNNWIHPFAAQISYFWTSTTDSTDITKAFTVQISTNEVTTSTKADSVQRAYVCVR
jgi:hypothetical protein